jgi:hypothetical protein
MDTHFCFPLTDANKAEYERLNAAKAQLATTTDINERIKLKVDIGQASQEIRRIGMNNQLLPLSIPKPNEDKAEIERLQRIIDEQREQIALLRQRLAPQPANNSVPAWQAAAVDMMI